LETMAATLFTGQMPLCLPTNTQSPKGRKQINVEFQQNNYFLEINSYLSLRKEAGLSICNTTLLKFNIMAVVCPISTPVLR